jgi:hypothetical protein
MRARLLNRRLTLEEEFDDEWGKRMKPKEGFEIDRRNEPEKSGNKPKARRQTGYEPRIAHKNKGKVMKKSRRRRRRRR